MSDRRDDDAVGAALDAGDLDEAGDGIATLPSRRSSGLAVSVTLC